MGTIKFIFVFIILCSVSLASSTSARRPSYLERREIEEVIRLHNEWKKTEGYVGLTFNNDEDLKRTLTSHQKRYDQENRWKDITVKNERGSIVGYAMFTSAYKKSKVVGLWPVIGTVMDRLSIPEGYGFIHFSAEFLPDFFDEPDLASLTKIYRKLTDYARRLVQEKAILPESPGGASLFPHTLLLPYNKRREKEIRILQALGYTVHDDLIVKGRDFESVILSLDLVSR